MHGIWAFISFLPLPIRLVSFLFQCQSTSDMHYREQQPVCDLQAIEKEFKAGKYNSIVSNITRSKDTIHWVYKEYSFSYSVFCFSQKAFHADVTSVMQKSLKEEQFVPEDQRLTNQARIQYAKVRILTFLNICFLLLH